MADTWFTSDTHFGHRAMVEREWRPQFATVAEMDEALIENWNETVTPGDTVWHLGDVGLGHDAHILGCVRRLNGTIHLVPGNHDSVWPGHRQAHKFQQQWLEEFDSIQPYARRRIAGQNVMLSHFPYDGDHQDFERFSQYRLRDEGLALIHGHVHKEWQVRGRQVNVGVDVWDLRPVHLDQLAQLVEKF